MGSESSFFSENFHWSNSVIVITLITVLIIIGVVFSFWYYRAISPFFRWTLTLAIVIPILYVFLSIPLCLSITPTDLTIKKIGGTKRMPIDDIKSISLVRSGMLNNSTRIFGSGGLFGYLGYFRSPSLGKYEVFATEWKNLILIETTSEKKIVISSQNPNELVHYFASIKELK